MMTAIGSTNIISILIISVGLGLTFLLLFRIDVNFIGTGYFTVL